MIAALAVLVALVMANRADRAVTGALTAVLITLATVAGIGTVGLAVLIAARVRHQPPRFRSALTANTDARARLTRELTDRREIPATSIRILPPAAADRQEVTR